jgi:AAA family ATP:ADP antiporter
MTLTALNQWTARLFKVEPGETRAMLSGLALFFLVFTSYFMLRPVRETMGIAGGVKNLQWLFTATFVFTLVALPFYGWLAARVQRRRVLPWVYTFFGFCLLLFSALFTAMPDSAWSARTFYVWYSVSNMIAISIAWSVVAELFRMDQAKRLFAIMAGGASLGGLTGPILGTLLVKPIGHAGLLILSATLLICAIAAAQSLRRWRQLHPMAGHDSTASHRPIGGSPFTGATEIFRSPYLLGISSFVMLLTCVTTFLYFEQAHLVAEHFPVKEDQTRVFGMIDTVVQSLALLTQFFFTGRIAQRLGVGILLVAVPLVVMAGFLCLALAPGFAVFVVIMIVRRAGEYALVRPGREMLFTVVSPEAKYKAKNFIDTVVYRGSDAVGAWLKTWVDMLAAHPAIAALIGAGFSLAWAFNGAALARAQRRRAEHQRPLIEQ